MRKYFFLLFSIVTFSAKAQLSDYYANPLPTDSISKAFIGVSKKTGNTVSRFKISPDSLYKNIYYSNGDFYGSGTSTDPFKVKSKSDSAATVSAIALKANLASPSFTGTVTLPATRLSSIHSAPSTASSAGTAGDVRFTDTGVYICIATNTWIKCTGATF